MVLRDDTVDDEGDSAALPWEFPCGAAWGCGAAPGMLGAVGLLERAHRIVVECLEACPEDALERPVPGRHGRSAAHLFGVLLMHDLYHAGQIRTRRTVYR